MNTTTAAKKANVTVRTIRTWCRRGVIGATKQAGQWVIDAASLAHRIAIGQRKTRMTTPQPRYRIEQGTAVRYGKERTVYTIVRTDGTPAGYGKNKDHRIHDAEFLSLETAEFYMKFYENTPDGYRIERTAPRRNSMSSQPYWLLTGSTQDDPDRLRMTLDTNWTPPEGSAWPEGTQIVDALIRFANQHAAGAAKRIQAKAEKDAIAAAEAAVREAREAQLAEVRRRKGALATPRQVEFILQLLEARERSGEGGGFFLGPRDRAGIEELSKGEASLYIDSLKGNY